MPPIPDDPSGFTAREMGFPGPPPVATSLPPGDGGWTTPNFLSFAALVNTAARAYRGMYDEAVRDSPRNALAMRRDPVLMGSLRLRQRPTAQLTWHITPRDETDPAEQEAAKLVTDIITATPRFQKFKMLALEALWYGHYGLEIKYKWDKDLFPGMVVLRPHDFVPINGDKLRFRWDGTPGVLVNPMYPGPKEISPDGGWVHWITPQERQQYLIHEHEPDDADWTEPELGGQIHGVGIRGRLYWFWWLKQQVFGLMLNYLQRFSNGLTIFYYNASDPRARQEAEAAARQQFSNVALLYPRWNTERPDTNKVERLEVSAASPTLLQNLVDGYFDDVMVKFILGQTLSHTASATGMGSGLAELQGDTLDEIIKYDAVDLGETIQTDLIDVLYRYNAPGVRPGRFEFEIDSPNSEELMKYGQVLYEWGVPLDEDQAYKIAQWTRPQPGAGVISKLGMMQPASVGGPAPQGVPVVSGGGAAPVQMKRKPPTPRRGRKALAA